MKNLLFMAILSLVLLASCRSVKDHSTRGLLITGNDHPAHKWRETTPVIKSILEKDSSVVITVSEDPEILKDVTTEKYDFIVLNYCNWEDPKGLSEYAKAGFLSFLRDGGGLIVLHFSNGAFHPSLPGAGESDWPEYRNIVRRVWDHDGASKHDAYGEIHVNVTGNKHFITRGLHAFDTKDELYFNQVGDQDLNPLLSARSKVSGKEEPLAWAYSYHKARVFQTLLGHSGESYQPAEYQEMLQRAVMWVTGKEKK